MTRPGSPRRFARRISESGLAVLLGLLAAVLLLVGAEWFFRLDKSFRWLDPWPLSFSRPPLDEALRPRLDRLDTSYVARLEPRNAWPDLGDEGARIYRFSAGGKTTASIT